MRELRSNHPVVSALDPEDEEHLNTRDDWDTQRAVVISQLNDLVTQARQNWDPANATCAPFLESIAKWVDRQHATLKKMPFLSPPVSVQPTWLGRAELFQPSTRPKDVRHTRSKGPPTPIPSSLQLPHPNALLSPRDRMTKLGRTSSANRTAAAANDESETKIPPADDDGEEEEEEEEEDEEGDDEEDDDDDDEVEILEDPEFVRIQAQIDDVRKNAAETLETAETTRRMKEEQKRKESDGKRKKKEEKAARKEEKKKAVKAATMKQLR